MPWSRRTGRGRGDDDEVVPIAGELGDERPTAGDDHEPGRAVPGEQLLDGETPLDDRLLAHDPELQVTAGDGDGDPVADVDPAQREQRAGALLLGVHVTGDDC